MLVIKLSLFIHHQSHQFVRLNGYSAEQVERQCISLAVELPIRQLFVLIDHGHLVRSSLRLELKNGVQRAAGVLIMISFERHRDVGLITLLYQSDVQDLQVGTARGDGLLFVNPGYDDAIAPWDAAAEAAATAAAPRGGGGERHCHASAPGGPRGPSLRRVSAKGPVGPDSAEWADLSQEGCVRDLWA
ncbi:hypothetical protein E4U53_003619 [Claviceps sorghi]|nr:hypothetical protein E4U53_003619 [Claviceps sorghi]